jgi:hypothetical protein
MGMGGSLIGIRNSPGYCKVSERHWKYGLRVRQKVRADHGTMIDALGGSSVGMLICNLAPGDKYAKDTLRTLK